jgi:uncharacterized membrane protein YjgN (DUF898 family)
MDPSHLSETPETSSFLNSITPIEPREHQLGVQFTGSGSEYFRIWIVNLLLMLFSLGLYYPWAKVRRLRYFHANTLVDGAPLDFHGDPRKMLRGTLLAGLLVLLYSIAGRFSPLAGLLAFAIVTAIWPALFKSSMQFRLANTSWRGLRFRFLGTLGGAYRALLPLFVPAVLVLAALALVPIEHQPPGWYFAFLGAVMLSLALLLPWLWWNLKRYQHENYALGQQQTELRSTVGAFYAVFLKTLGVFLLASIAALALLFVLGAAGFGGWPLLRGRGGLGAIIIAGLFALFAAMFVIQIITRPYFTSRLQNLLWSRTGNHSLRFRSRLGFVPLLGLTLKNWLLMLLTLGLYWPFAAVALARMRLQAVSVTSRVNPETLIDQARAQAGDAAGDAAGDLLGLDIGL